MKIERKLADKKFYGEKRSTKDIQYIVIQTINNNATTHYHIRSSAVYQIIPDEYMSNATNGARASKNGFLHGICTKYNSVSIGVPCKMSLDDKQTCLNLVMTLKQRYKIDNDNIVRQVDVTGGFDPEEWCDNDRWVKDIKKKLIDI